MNQKNEKLATWYLSEGRRVENWCADSTDIENLKVCWRQDEDGERSNLFFFDRLTGKQRYFYDEITFYLNQTNMNVETIARVCHEMNKAYCASIGDLSQPEWNDAPDWQKNSAIAGVRFHIENPLAPPSASHESWLKVKTEDGWKYGSVKNADLKEHPCFVPYDLLPVEQKAKDFLFKQTVESLKGLIKLQPRAITTLVKGASYEVPIFEVTNKGLKQAEHSEVVRFCKGSKDDETVLRQTGFFTETLIKVAKQYLEDVNVGPLASRETSTAITKLDEALGWLGKRAEDRAEREVQGTYKP